MHIFLPTKSAMESPMADQSEYRPPTHWNSKKMHWISTLGKQYMHTSTYIPELKHILLINTKVLNFWSIRWKCHKVFCHISWLKWQQLCKLKTTCNVRQHSNSSYKHNYEIICFLTFLVWFISHSFADCAFVIVSWVVNVYKVKKSITLLAVVSR